MALLRVAPLPPAALDAAAVFHAEMLPRIRAALESPDCLVIVFPPADRTQRGWRVAAVQELAREHAPARVNGIESHDERAIAAAAGYLSGAPGVTGQYLVLDETGVEAP